MDTKHSKSTKVTAHKYAGKAGHLLARQLTWKNSADSYGFKTMSDGKHAWFVSQDGIHYRRVPATHLYLSTRCRALASANKPALSSCHRKKRASTPSKKRKSAKSPAKKRKSAKSPSTKRAASKSPAKKRKSGKRTGQKKFTVWTTRELFDRGGLVYSSSDYALFHLTRQNRFYKRYDKGLWRSTAAKNVPADFRRKALREYSKSYAA